MIRAAQQKLAPVFPVELGGKTRNLQFTNNAFVLFEEAMGRSIFEVLPEIQRAIVEGQPHRVITLKMLRAMLYAGLCGAEIEEQRRRGRRNPEPTITLYDVGDWIADCDYTRMLSVVLEAQQAAAPEKSSEEAAETGRPTVVPSASSVG